MHIVDGSSQQPEYEFDAVRLELEMFNPELAEKPFIVAYNKMDLSEAYEKWESFRETLQARGIEPFCMSAVTREGTNEVINSAYKLVCHKRRENNEKGKYLLIFPRRISVSLYFVCIYTTVSFSHLIFPLGQKAY